MVHDVHITWFIEWFVKSILSFRVPVSIVKDHALVQGSQTSSPCSSSLRAACVIPDPGSLVSLQVLILNLLHLDAP